MSVRRALVDRAGGLRFIDTELEPGGVEDRQEGERLELVTYDLAALAPLDDLDLEVLRGHGDERWVPGGWRDMIQVVSPKGWWHTLAEILIARVGTKAWSDDATLLAWDEGPPRLLVRQSEHALRIIEGVFDELGARSSRALPLTLALRRDGRRIASLALDVPWGREARASRGPALTYLVDLDVEVSMSVCGIDPIFQRLECGLGMTAVRSGPGAEGRLHVALAWSPGPPRLTSQDIREFPMFPPGLPSSCVLPCPIESPDTQVVRWHGVVPARAGEQVEIELADGVVGQLTVGQERGPSSRPARAWRRVPLDDIAATARQQGSRFRVELVGARSGRLGSGILTLGRRSGMGSVNLRAPERRWLIPRGEKGWRGYEVDLPIAGGIRIEAVACGAVASPHALDLRIEMGNPADKPREIPLLILTDTSELASTTVALPRAHLVVTSRRVSCTGDDARPTTFKADLGRGPERLTVTVRAAPETR